MLPPDDRGRNPTPATPMRQTGRKSKCSSRAQSRGRPLKTLDRVLSKAGAGSRTEARAWIRDGRVKVNGRVMRDPDCWVDMQRDRVRLDDAPLETRERMYVLLYKPTGYLTTYKDPQGRPTVYDLIAD